MDEASPHPTELYDAYVTSAIQNSCQLFPERSNMCSSFVPVCVALFPYLPITLYHQHSPNAPPPAMSTHDDAPELPQEMTLPEQLTSEAVRSLHARIEREWSSLMRTACQTAAGRALWKHVIDDPLAEVLAGESCLRSLYAKMRKDRMSNARELSGVIMAVRTLWFDSKIEAAIDACGEIGMQVVLLGAGMDARAYRLSCLKESSVFEVDFAELLQVKVALLQEATKTDGSMPKAKSVVRVAADVRDKDWPEKLQRSGFCFEKSTIWILEGLLYYMTHIEAMQILQFIAGNCSMVRTVLLADFMNEASAALCRSTFQFYCDWPEELLPSLGFLEVKLSQIGDPDAQFGLMSDPQNLFNKTRKLPRTVEIDPEDGMSCRRLYLVEASGIPDQENI